MKLALSLRAFFFFFQAEDGIRDVAVTGVQTCALPISWFKEAETPPDRLIYWIHRPTLLLYAGACRNSHGRCESGTCAMRAISRRSLRLRFIRGLLLLLLKFLGPRRNNAVDPRIGNGLA